MEFNELMAAFGNEIGIADLRPDEDGICNLAFDGMNVSFTSVPETERLAVWAEIGEMPPEGGDRLCRAMMEAMFMGQATAGASFSINGETGRIYHQRIESLRGLDFDEFRAMVEKFVNTLEQWRKLTAEYRPVAAEVQRIQAEERAEASAFGVSGFMQV